MQARWADEVRERSFKSTLEFVAEERPGLLVDITQQLFNLHLFVHSLNSRETKSGTAVIHAMITVNGPEHLQNVIQKLSGIDGMLSVRRA